MEFTEYLKQHYKNLLDILIGIQLQQEGLIYSNETNMERSREYETAWADHDLTRDHFEHVTQERGKTKRDLLFTGSIPIEVKTLKANFNKDGQRGARKGLPKTFRVKWAKRSGDSLFEMRKNVPAFAAVYQKFDIRKKVPAGLAVISKERLELIFDEERWFASKANLDLVISRDDFDKGWFIEAKIPEMREGVSDELRKIDEEAKRNRSMKLVECVKRFSTGRTITCNA